MAAVTLCLLGVSSEALHVCLFLSHFWSMTLYQGVQEVSLVDNISCLLGYYTPSVTCRMCMVLPLK